MTCATWGEGGRGRERGEGLCSSSIVLGCSAGRSKRGSCQKVFVVISDGKGRKKKAEGRGRAAGSRWINCGATATVPRRAERSNLVTRKRAEKWADANGPVS